MNKRFGILTLALAVALGSVACNSQQKSAETKDKTVSNSGVSGAALTGDALMEKIQPVVSKTSDGRYKVTETFEGPSGLVGLVIGEANGGGSKLIAWATSDGENLMPGPLFNQKFENLSETNLDGRAGYTKIDDLAKQVEDRGFVIGKSGPIITVFFEPYCGYCAQVWEGLKPLVDKGDVRMRAVMVGFLKDDATARAANIHNASDPAKALKDWESSKDKANAKTATASEEDIAYIQETNNIMNSGGISGTPALLYCDKDSSELKLIKGMPGDIAAFAKTAGNKGNSLCD